MSSVNFSNAAPWRLLLSGARPAAENMALDEVLLEQAAPIGAPVLRFYSWTEPAATFGYFQKYAEVEKLTNLRPLVRRPTGGGIVPHDADWTYSLIFPPGHPWYELKAVASYKRAHLWIQAAFREAGFPTHLAPEARKDSPGQCFAGAERFDLLWKDRKIAGAAQRRSRTPQSLTISSSVSGAPSAIRSRFVTTREGRYAPVASRRAPRPSCAGWKRRSLTAASSRRTPRAPRSTRSSPAPARALRR